MKRETWRVAVPMEGVQAGEVNDALKPWGIRAVINCGPAIPPEGFADVTLIFPEVLDGQVAFDALMEALPRAAVTPQNLKDAAGEQRFIFEEEIIAIVNQAILEGRIKL